MSRTRRWLAVLWICAVSSSLAGCAMFREGGPPPVEPWPLTPSAAPVTASVIVTGEKFLNGAPHDASEMLPRWSELIREECLGSGLFSAVTVGGDADRRIYVHVVSREEGSIPLAVVCGLTLFIVPCRATDEITLRTDVKDRSGKTLGSYERSETYVLWMELLFVFVMPFHYPPTESKALIQDLTRATLADARAAGVL